MNKYKLSLKKDNFQKTVINFDSDSSLSRTSKIENSIMNNSKRKINEVSDSKNDLSKNKGLKFFTGAKKPEPSTNKETLKDIIEYKNINYKVIGLIDGCVEILEDKLGSTIEDKENYELIEKSIIDKQLKENERLKNLKIDITDQYNELVKNYNKYSSELASYSQNYSTNEKIKEKNGNLIYSQSQKLKDIFLETHKLNEMITRLNIERDNIFRALIKVINDNKIKVPSDLKEIYKKYNNDYYGFSQKPDFSIKIQYLKENVEKLEKELNDKNNEIDKLKNILNINTQ